MDIHQKNHSPIPFYVILESFSIYDFDITVTSHKH